MKVLPLLDPRMQCLRCLAGQQPYAGAVTAVYSAGVSQCSLVWLIVFGATRVAPSVPQVKAAVVGADVGRSYLPSCGTAGASGADAGFTKCMDMPLEQAVCAVGCKSIRCLSKFC